ncbi:MAG: catalase [Clostridia bacterium]|nr:catalase [Clostridia bacterium]
MHPLKHFCTVARHRHLVIRHCFQAGIGWQGLSHDLSKYSPVEFWNSAVHYQGNRSPNDHEREARGYSLSWLHHKGRNRHHHEYWTDYNMKTHQVEPVKMPLNYVIEMFCDRVAACKTYQGKAYTDEKPLEYFNRGVGRKVMHEETGEFLKNLLTMLAREGEDKTFAWIRAYRKTHRDY